MTTSINMKKFEDLLKDLPEDKQALAANLFEELKFMKETMAELKQLVQEQGTIQTFTQGQTSYPRENPALAAYNKTLGKYNQTYKQLMEVLPKDDEKEQKDELLDFIG